MAKQIINITERFTIPMYFKGEVVMSSRIGNSLAHRYIVCPDGSVKFIRWSDPDNDFIEVKNGGPAPKLGDNILYMPEGPNTKWRYVKPPRETIVGKAMWNAGLYLGEDEWYWAKEGDEKLNLDPYDHGVLSWRKGNRIDKVFMVWEERTFKGFNEFEYIIGTPSYFVANAVYRDEIEDNIKEVIDYLLDRYVQIGKIRETRISGMYFQ
jgi:hypothetical protein